MSRNPIGFSASDDDINYDDRWIEGESSVPEYVQDVGEWHEDEFSEGYAEDN